MYYVYVLYSQKSKRLYTGYTKDLKQRLSQHNKHRGGKYSKNNAPFILFFYESYLAKSDAAKQELFYKGGYGREVLSDKIKNSLKDARVWFNGRMRPSQG